MFRKGVPPSHSRHWLAIESPASVGAHADRHPRADVQCPCASDTLVPCAASVVHAAHAQCLQTYPAFLPCSATSQNWFPMRPSPTGVRRSLPAFRPFVSSNVYPGKGRPIASASLIGGLSKGVNDPMLHFVISSQLSSDRLFGRDEVQAAAATLRTANDNITRVTPLIIMLTPTSVPIAHIELEGHCR